jgi:hypothetical protein
MVRAFWFFLPILVLAGLVAFVFSYSPFEKFSNSSPPVEEIAVESTRLAPGEISLSIRADGSIPVSIAQIQVDGAYRIFTLDPPGPIARLSQAKVTIPYPWIDGETHHIVLLTSTGVAFEHTIDVAQVSPDLWGSSLALLTLIGLLLGVAPVATGMLAFPAMRAIGPAGIQFLLALTVGLLAYLFVDTLREGLDAASNTLGRLRGETLVWATGALTTLLLLAVGRRDGRPPEGAVLAFYIALGIGLHNLGEGLVVGAAFAAGAASLAKFLIVGFIIHNVTEGVGIAVPLTRARPKLITFVGLALLAGLPAIFGVWAGTQAINPYFVALCFGVGAGAILQVVIEVTGITIRTESVASLAKPIYASGIAVGLVVMYATALLV